MAGLRASPPERLGGLKVVGVRDYLNSTEKTPGGTPEQPWSSKPLDAPKGDLVMLDLETRGNYVAVRPSGTEPKVKFYMFAYDEPGAITDLDAAKAALRDRLAAMEADLRAAAGVE